jgi:hypothetical protein
MIELLASCETSNRLDHRSDHKMDTHTDGTNAMKRSIAAHEVGKIVEALLAG